MGRAPILTEHLQRSGASSIVIVGSLNIDFVIPVQRLPRPGETVAGSDVQFFAGGKGANQACAAGRLGGRAFMVGLVGRDPFGPKLLDSLRYAGVDVSQVGFSDRPTGAAFICVLPDGDNAIVISPGANAALNREVVARGLEQLGPNGFLMCQLEIPLPTVEYCLAEARRRGAVTILDPAPAQTLSPDILERVDILTPNESEAAILVGRAGQAIPDFRQAEEIACRLREFGPRTVILKLGSQGCYVLNESLSAPVPGFAVAAVDTTGAGDVFNGALAVALSEGKGLMDACVFANAAAALSVEKPGAQSSIPQRREVDLFLKARAVDNADKPEIQVEG